MGLDNCHTRPLLCFLQPSLAPFEQAEHFTQNMASMVWCVTVLTCSSLNTCMVLHNNTHCCTISQLSRTIKRSAGRRNDLSSQEVYVDIVVYKTYVDMLRHCFQQQEIMGRSGKQTAHRSRIILILSLNLFTANY